MVLLEYGNACMNDIEYKLYSNQRKYFHLHVTSTFECTKAHRQLQRK